MLYSSGARFSRAKATGSFRVLQPSSRRVAAHSDTLREARVDAAYWVRTSSSPMEIQERFPSGKWVTVETVNRKFPAKTPSKRHHAAIAPMAVGGVDQFWDVYEDELVKSVAKEPFKYALEVDEPPEVYARRIRETFQRNALVMGLGSLNLDSNTFKRLARRLGIKKFSQSALKDAYARLGGKA